MWCRRPTQWKSGGWPCVGWWLALLMLLALGVRLHGIDQSLVTFHPTRHYRSAVIARACYYDATPSFEAWARRLADAARSMQPAGEPPFMEWIACESYRAIGHEDIRVPAHPGDDLLDPWRDPVARPGTSRELRRLRNRRRRALPLHAVRESLPPGAFSRTADDAALDRRARPSPGTLVARDVTVRHCGASSSDWPRWSSR